MVQFSPSYRTFILFAIPLQNAVRSISGPDYAAALDSTGSEPDAKRREYVPPDTFAIVHGQLGEKDQAFEWYCQVKGNPRVFEAKPVCSGTKNQQLGDCLEALIGGSNR